MVSWFWLVGWIASMCTTTLRGHAGSSQPQTPGLSTLVGCLVGFWLVGSVGSGRISRCAWLLGRLVLVGWVHRLHVYNLSAPPCWKQSTTNMGSQECLSRSLVGSLVGFWLVGWGGCFCWLVGLSAWLSWFAWWLGRPGWFVIRPQKRNPNMAALVW